MTVASTEAIAPFRYRVIAEAIGPSSKTVVTQGTHALGPGSSINHSVNRSVRATRQFRLSAGWSGAGWA